MCTYDPLDVILDIPLKPKQIGVLLASFSVHAVSTSDPFVCVSDPGKWRISCQVHIPHSDFILRFTSPSYSKIQSCRRWLRAIACFRNDHINHRSQLF